MDKKYEALFSSIPDLFYYTTILKGFLLNEKRKKLYHDKNLFQNSSVMMLPASWQMVLFSTLP